MSYHKFSFSLICLTTHSPPLFFFLLFFYVSLFLYECHTCDVQDSFHFISCSNRRGMFQTRGTTEEEQKEKKRDNSNNWQHHAALHENFLSQTRYTIGKSPTHKFLTSVLNFVFNESVIQIGWRNIKIDKKNACYNIALFWKVSTKNMFYLSEFA